MNAHDAYDARTVAEVVDLVDPGPYLDVLEERFGIVKATFDDFLFFRPKTSTLSIVRRDLLVPHIPDPMTLGMPFFYANMRHPRPTSAAVLKFGVYAKRNVLDFGASQVMDFVFGREIPLDSDDIDRLDGPGYVIGRHHGSIVGIGACWQQDDGLVLTGMVPKVWAAQLGDPQELTGSSAERDMG